MVAIIKGDTTINKTLAFGEYIGQHNNGNHTTLYSDVNTLPERSRRPGPIVDHNGNFLGWATFHVISADGGSAKHINGYFVSSFVNHASRSRPAPPTTARATSARTS